MSAHELFEVYLAVLGAPSRYFFRIMARFAEDPLERERIEELASPEYHDDFDRYCSREQRTFVEVLEDFPSVRLSLELFVELVPRLQARQFSIASSRLAHPQELHVCVAVLQHTTPFRRHKLGVCSSWLAGLAVGSSVPIWVKGGSLQLPKTPETPVLCVGPGTGIAPFRAVWQHLQHLADEQRDEQQQKQSMDGGVYMWAGFRSRRADFLYGPEMQSNAESPQGVIRRLETAFSRDAPDGRKVYVQHRLLELRKLVWELLGKGGVLLVAGNASNGMTSAVQEVLVEIARLQGGLEEEQAQKLVSRLQKSGIYQVEAW